jgi:hypothetical protein
MPAWFITFHGGGYPCKTPSSPAPSYTGSINTLMGLILSGPLPPMQELRGFIFDSKGNLYIANAYKNLSQILQFQPTGSGTYATTGTPWTTTNLTHPFDLATDSAGNIYASNQDTPQVTYYNASGVSQGVFIPSPNSQTPGPSLLQLRGIAWDGASTWYVADEEGSADGSGKKGSGAVYIYDNSGNYKGAIAVTDPIHLLYQNNVLYIGSGKGNMVYYYTSGAATAQALVTDITPGITINEVSGIVIPGDGYIYIGSRLNLQVLQFTLKSPTSATGGAVFFDQLPDFPEFIGLVP